MQTFMPFDKMDKSVKCLDDRRLCKQRMEALCIYRCITQYRRGWRNHPAVNMWRGYEKALAVYHNLCIEEWVKRGFNNYMTMLDIEPGLLIMPYWMKSLAFHQSHQSNLIRKDPEHYRPIFGKKVPDNLPYVWPVPLQSQKIEQARLAWRG